MARTYESQKIVDGKKRCSDCGQWKPADTDHFYRRSTVSCGLNAKCSECVSRRYYPQKDTRTPEEKFWSNVAVGHESECWEWRKGRDRAGYGRTKVKIGSKSEVLAHRVAFALANNRVAVELDVLHSCDNPPCCNPAHLRQGTHTDNMLDMAKKGRATWAILSPDKVREIRRLIAHGLSDREIAPGFEVSHLTIKAIRNGSNWKHVA